MKPVYRSWIKRIVFVALLCTGATSVADKPMTTGVAADTGLRYWEWNAQGVLFRLTQRLPDQTRAYFMARGFDSGYADRIANQCIFQSMFKNIAGSGGATISIDLDTWRVNSNSGEGRLLTREEWQDEMRKNDISRAATIAFEWSLLPTQQVYTPGDYNWGMTSYGLEPGKTFDLDFSWKREGRVFQGHLKGVECAPDIHPDTEP